MKLDRSLFIQTLLFIIISGGLFFLISIFPDMDNNNKGWSLGKMAIFLLCTAPLYYYLIAKQRHTTQSTAQPTTEELPNKPPKKEVWFDVVVHSENKITLYWAAFLIAGGLLIDLFGLPGVWYGMYGFISLLVLFGIAWKQGKLRLRFAVAFFVLIVSLVIFATLFLH